MSWTRLYRDQSRLAKRPQGRVDIWWHSLATGYLASVHGIDLLRYEVMRTRSQTRFSSIKHSANIDIIFDESMPAMYVSKGKPRKRLSPRWLVQGGLVDLSMWEVDRKIACRTFPSLEFVPFKGSAILSYEAYQSDRNKREEGYYRTRHLRDWERPAREVVHTPILGTLLLALQWSRITNSVSSISGSVIIWRTPYFTCPRSMGMQNLTQGPWS